MCPTSDPPVNANGVAMLMTAPFAPTVENLTRLLQAFSAITFREFAKTIGCERDESYARGVWPGWKDHTLAFICYRSPPHGANLLALALEKIRLAETSGRVIGCPGEGRCHEHTARCESCGDVARVCHEPACVIHAPVSDARVRAVILGCFDRREGRRERHSAQSIFNRIDAAGVHAPCGVDPARAQSILAEVLAAGELEPTPRPGWEQYLQRPLAVLPPGKHAAECPVEFEHWNEHAAHDPDVCAFVAVAAPKDDEEDEDD